MEKEVELTEVEKAKKLIEEQDKKNCDLCLEDYNAFVAKCKERGCSLNVITQSYNNQLEISIEFTKNK